MRAVADALGLSRTISHLRRACPPWKLRVRGLRAPTSSPHLARHQSGHIALLLVRVKPHIVASLATPPHTASAAHSVTGRPLLRVAHVSHVPHTHGCGRVCCQLLQLHA
jgi:hypothetical protein